MTNARWVGDQNNPNRDLSDPNWISREGYHIEQNTRGAYNRAKYYHEAKKTCTCNCHTIQEKKDKETIMKTQKLQSENRFLKQDFKTGDRILLKNFCTSDSGVCPDQIEKYDEELECDICNQFGSFFLIDEKYAIGLCQKCLSIRDGWEIMTDEKIKQYNQRRLNECYDYNCECEKTHTYNEVVEN